MGVKISTKAELDLYIKKVEASPTLSEERKKELIASVKGLKDHANYFGGKSET